MIDVFGTDHHGYVARLKGAIKASGYDDSKLEVKLLQLVRLLNDDEIVKMSKRTGNTVTLRDLMDTVGVNAARYYFSRYFCSYYYYYFNSVLFLYLILLN